MDSERIGIVVNAIGRTGVLHQLTGVIARHEGDITSVEILGNWPDEARTYFEVVLPEAADALVEDLRALPIVRSVELVKTLQAIYGNQNNGLMYGWDVNNASNVKRVTTPTVEPAPNVDYRTYAESFAAGGKAGKGWTE